ncbi:flavin-dependent oxidoreductase [Marinomonas mediterranea]|jgi:2-polyprenyl-6-methoxyphenol hydroxylase and related FAD-dependent oxidoreductases|uniref:Monooxygenase FAD-binding protein n=1 Tax=Marinomonas mediterranea (strain ATCC 700492 / JCM 21426 / NBRC 103028 / MMB-1) TaxID=717774 RepID=F2JY64_MARM1|nr:flavin-dependent oxidoreductase [Marinomonas mediterranea]ADZ90800.1 monooxygenase FAD-binding protein [Marinomonas mediterranea MMB-1]WCN08840.1 flavin-dependent oxidoreductase [Marinomonas mediterranea]WCN12885.1 flavin-dependent oxidoreductase [Marinomonas mediterranea]WCN16953.1 flavin-dependent oxidoreductase [Marinomonas mediterranea MMB-1]
MTSNQHTSSLPVLIAGGGIGGLATALTLHQIGIPCIVFESVVELKPLGVGINIQPNAVRELYDLGITDDELESIGIKTKEWALVGLNGKDVYSEPRGLEAGYKWPQYSVYRGELQMLLYRLAKERLGSDAIKTGHKVVGYENLSNSKGVVAKVKLASGELIDVQGSLLVAADGLHSAVRAQMHPNQPPIHWGGAVMWRGVAKSLPIRTGASFVGVGRHDHRVVFYPISEPDPETGLVDVNWIAEVTMDTSDGLNGDWNKKVDVEDIVHHFEGWNYDWLDVPSMLRGSSDIYEYPMIDRDPVPTWQDKNVILLGDAAHVMYPTGSNGATQAIVDARILGACLIENGVSAQALEAFNGRLCEDISKVVLRNRGLGPFILLKMLDERCNGEFDDIEEVFPKADREEAMLRYKSAAGYEMEKLNQSPATIDVSALK